MSQLELTIKHYKLRKIILLQIKAVMLKQLKTKWTLMINKMTIKSFKNTLNDYSYYSCSGKKRPVWYLKA